MHLGNRRRAARTPSDAGARLRWLGPVLAVVLGACEHDLLRGGPSIAGLDVIYLGPATAGANGIAGHYHEAFDCTAADVATIERGEAGHCFRKHGSRWRVWHSGCGWELGYNVGAASERTWRRFARTYAGACSTVPVEQRRPIALNTSTFFDEAGRALPGLAAAYLLDDLALDEVFPRLNDARRARCP